ncbi:hypothetical protein HOU03_gp066 [Caulobacter phage CcrSC]|uniref:Uncharacterized protein n=1 Tax=Caulobacter phage CcrSC TaxID=2283272 RepID=A0A385EFT0_9CAUD|nr:hypothetical protein HOU03_gp066 [Caulobacter phage CcrSC]AXQ69648.1 hypothetical protein CcrSC_gp066c [Caulobacter phage CcrSC]
MSEDNAPLSPLMLKEVADAKLLSARLVVQGLAGMICDRMHFDEGDEHYPDTPPEAYQVSSLRADLREAIIDQLVAESVYLEAQRRFDEHTRLSNI